MMLKIKVVCVEFENLKHFKNEKFKVDFYATDRVFENSELYIFIYNGANLKFCTFQNCALLRRVLYRSIQNVGALYPK